MEIKPNTFYKTRSGFKARIYAVDGCEPHRVHGSYLKDGAWVICTWCGNGEYSGYDTPYEDERDIVGVWTEPKPKLKAYLWPDILKNKYDVHYFEGEAPNTIYVRAEWLDQP